MVSVSPDAPVVRRFSAPTPPRSLSLCLQTEIHDAVERIEVEDGWVSMRLPEDMGTGDLLLMPLD